MKRLTALAALFVSLSAGAMPPAFFTCPQPPFCAWPLHLSCKSPPVQYAGCAVCECQMPPKASPEYGILVPRFLVSHVVYTPPGRGSSINYSATAGVGTTLTLTDSEKRSVKTTASTTARIMGVVESTASVAVGGMWGTTRVDALDFSVSRSTGFRKVGISEDIDHDWDEVWFFVRPAILLTLTPESYWGPQTVTWTLDPNQQLIPYYLFVGELRGRMPMPKPVLDDLMGWGFTQRDIQEILKAHPFPGGLGPNQTPDAARFEYVGAFPYRPSQNTSVQSLELSRKETNTQTVSADISFSFDTEMSAGVNVLRMLSVSLKIANGYTMSASASTKTALSNEEKSSITLVQPPLTYTGPTLVRVYVDRIYKTFLSTQDGR